MMSNYIFGVDISKKKFDVTFLEGNKEKHKIFDNTAIGIKNFVQWVESSTNKSLDCHICLEATGFYGEELALSLHDKGYRVSVVNPARIKAYARSELSRNKTDKADSGVIARFCRAHAPKLWIPPSLALQQLRELYKCLTSLKADKLKITNRLEKFLGQTTPISETWNTILDTLNESIARIEEEIQTFMERNSNINEQYNLLKTIPAIGDITALAILASLPDIKGFTSAREVAAFAGLTPCQRQSGTSLKGKTRLSKIGSSQLRKALYMPAIVAKNYNPLIMKFCKKLQDKGKHNMAIIGAVMRKLLHIAYGVLKSGQPFREII